MSPVEWIVSLGRGGGFWRARKSWSPGQAPVGYAVLMKSIPKLNVAIVGLGFGAEFIPLWQQHPHTCCHAICQRTRKKLDAVGDYFGVSGATRISGSCSRIAPSTSFTSTRRYPTMRG